MIYATITGHLGQNPETRDVGGKTVCNFSIASNGMKKDDPPTWVRVAVWGKRAEWVKQCLRKGSAVIVVGTLSTRTFDGKNGKQTSLECQSDHVDFGGGGKREEAAPKQAAQPLGDHDDDNTPF